ncbi:MAG TPA: 50S ribosomal protein L13 [Fimbriimonadales bacterium]|nr:50S ribosomal protein L13 [Fimbriimonadales bacterium]
MKTTIVKPSEMQRKWYVVDATNQPIGRLAAVVARILTGKHKPTFSYNVDVGDHVIVINASKAILTGKKKEEKIYWHTMHPQGLRSATRGNLLTTKPEKLIHRAIWGMMPKHRLGRQMIKKLRIYPGAEHPHSAQNPEILSLGESK